MKPIKDYFKGKDLKIEYLNDYINGGNAVINMDILLEIIKKVQIDAIKTTVQACADNADADINFLGDLAREYMNPDEPFLSEEDYEVYVIKSSILEVADKLIKELE